MPLSRRGNTKMEINIETVAGVISAACAMLMVLKAYGVF